MAAGDAELSTEGPPTRWYLSTDRRTMYVNLLRGGKIVTATVHWDDDPTESMIAAALESLRSSGAEPTDGERWRVRRIGNLVFDLNTGPPTWWWPRIRIDRTTQGRRTIQIGWLRAAVGVWRRAPKPRS